MVDVYKYHCVSFPFFQNRDAWDLYETSRLVLTGSILLLILNIVLYCFLSSHVMYSDLLFGMFAPFSYSLYFILDFISAYLYIFQVMPFWYLFSFFFTSPRHPICYIIHVSPWCILPTRKLQTQQPFFASLHQMETFSALLAICAGNLPVPGVNNREAGDLRRYPAHYDVTVMDVDCFPIFTFGSPRYFYLVECYSCARGSAWCYVPWKQDSWGQHWAHLGPTGPRWAHVGQRNLAIWVDFCFCFFACVVVILLPFLSSTASCL